jgi:squalene-associated FAD-dependent desaturase
MSAADVTKGKNVAVIGGGWAGCAAAVELAAKGNRVTLFEAGHVLGGRARRTEINGMPLDNGQHILLGAYAESLRLMRMVGADTDAAMLRLPLQMRYPPNGQGLDFIAARLPAPFHLLVALLRAKGMAVQDKLALARFSTAARWMGWVLNNDCTVAELLDRFDQTERLNRLLWRPLCIAALNTPPETASAKVFLNVLRDSLGSSKRASSDMLLPRIDLTALFPERAAEFVERKGGTVLYGRNVRALHRDESGWRVETSQNADPGESGRFDAVVVATPAVYAGALLDGLVDTSPMAALEHEPITTCYLQYPADTKLSRPFYALQDDADAGKWGQFVFDRGQLLDDQAGLFAVIVSAASAAIELDRSRLQADIAVQLAHELQNPKLAQPLWSTVISEKRATFSCTPALLRPANETGIEGLAIAGDYTISDYPATLEAAVRSGVNAALHIAK